MLAIWLHNAKLYLFSNLDMVFGGLTGMSTSFLIIWRNFSDHVFEACATTLLVTIVGIVAGHYTKKLLSLIDKHVKQGNILIFFFPKVYSPQWRISARDWLLGLIRASLLAVLTTAIDMVSKGSLVLDYDVVLTSFIGGLLTYVVYSLQKGKKDGEQ